MGSTALLMTIPGCVDHVDVLAFLGPWFYAIQSVTFVRAKHQKQRAGTGSGAETGISSCKQSSKGDTTASQPADVVTCPNTGDVRDKCADLSSEADPGRSDKTPSTDTVSTTNQPPRPPQPTALRVSSNRDVHPQVYVVIHRKDAQAFSRYYTDKPLSLFSTEACTVEEVPDASLVQPTIALDASCPICLDPIIPTKPTAVTPCSHLFHAECLSQHVEETCPVCRKSLAYQNLDSTCEECDTSKDMWLCLGCGHVGCGRVQWLGSEDRSETQGHALEHYLSTSHRLARNVDSGRVWDYGQDCYLDATSNAPDTTPSSLRVDPIANATAELTDSLKLEYQYLASQQLLEQKALLDKRLAAVESDTRSTIEALRKELDTLHEKNAELTYSLVGSSKTLREKHDQKEKLRKEVFRLENMITEETPFVEALRANIADPKVHEASEVAQQKRSLSKKTLALQATIRSLSSERDALLAKFDEA
eukprot:m.52988 g.52988  ORF g.52988 m.52988 type:complete len:477 (+) comp11345_c1_seq2:134-1564(+)